MSLLLAAAGFVFPWSAAPLPARAEVTPSPAPSLALHEIPPNRIASVYVAEGFINEQLAEHVKSSMIGDPKVTLDPDRGEVLFTGILHVPVEELRAVNLDPKLGSFRFQVATRLETSHHGHLIIDFPLNETYFYPAGIKNGIKERVFIPVQMLSIALASARGYLAALSGDFQDFDKRTKSLQEQINEINHEIANTRDPDAKDRLQTDRQSLRVQLEAIPIERKQLEDAGKQYSALLGFTGQKELNLNDELAARGNALVLKVKLSQLVPYLDGIALGGVRIREDRKDGGGEKYLILDVNSDLAIPGGAPIVTTPSDRPPMRTPPLLQIRLNQALFESDALVKAEKDEMGSRIEDFKIDLKDDGLHVSGTARALLVFKIPFETTVSFASVGLDAFEARVSEIKVAGIDFEFLSKFILESLKRRLNHSLKGICRFKYVGKAGEPPALRVTIDPKDLVPAFPGLHLVSVDVRSKEFLMKIGRQ